MICFALVRIVCVSLNAFNNEIFFSSFFSVFAVVDVHTKWVLGWVQ